MLRPSDVARVIDALLLVLENDAVTPVVPWTPSIAETRLLRSFWSATAAETACPFSVKLTVPATLRLASVVLLVAVAVTPTPLAALLIAVAICAALDSAA